MSVVATPAGYAAKVLVDPSVTGGSSSGPSTTLWEGNGTNTFSLDPTAGTFAAAQVNGPTLSYTGGTFNDSVTLQNGIINTFAANVTFKAGSRISRRAPR